MSAPSTPRKGRRIWWVIAVVAALVVAVAAGVLIGQSGRAPVSASPTRTPSSVSPAPTATPGAAAARGCLLGTPPTAVMFNKLRAEKNFTPVGAVEFLGAYQQLSTYADPGMAVGARDALIAASAGNVLDRATALPTSGNPFGDQSSHAFSLYTARYVIELATPDQVVVALAGYLLKDGQAASTDGTHGVRGGGLFTLTPTGDGWQLVNGATVDAAAVESTGTSFSGGC